MFKNLFAATLAPGTLTANATPALALNGQEATDLCQQQASGCNVEHGADGRIIIMSVNGMITCMTPQAE